MGQPTERVEHERHQQDRRRRGRRKSELHLDRNSEYSWHREIDRFQDLKDLYSSEKRGYRSTRRESDEVITYKMLGNNNNNSYSIREFDFLPFDWGAANSSSSHRYSSVGGSDSSTTCERSPVFVDLPANNNSAHLNHDFSTTKTSESTRRGQHGEHPTFGVNGSVIFGAYLERIAVNHQGDIRQLAHNRSDHKGNEQNRNGTDYRNINGIEKNSSNKFDSALSKYLQNEATSVSHGETSSGFRCSDSEQGDVEEITVTELIYDSDDQWMDSGGGEGEVAAEDNLDDDRPQIQVKQGCSLSIQVPAKRFDIVSSTEHQATSGTGYTKTG